MTQDGNLKEEWVFIGPMRSGDHGDGTFLGIGGYLSNDIKLVAAIELSATQDLSTWHTGPCCHPRS